MSYEAGEPGDADTAGLVPTDLGPASESGLGVAHMDRCVKHVPPSARCGDAGAAVIGLLIGLEMQHIKGAGRMPGVSPIGRAGP